MNIPLKLSLFLILRLLQTYSNFVYFKKYNNYKHDKDNQRKIRSKNNIEQSAKCINHILYKLKEHEYIFKYTYVCIYLHMYTQYI